MEKQLVLMTDHQQLAEIVPIWNKLWEQSGPQGIFLDPEWLVTWWEYFHKDKILSVVIVFFDQEVVGIAPWYVEKRLGYRRLKTFGHGFIDYEGVLMRKGMEDRVIDSLRHWLLTTNSYDEAVFDRLLSNNWILKHDQWRQRGMRFEKHPSTISLVARLDEGWEDVRSKLSKKIRSDTERQIRRLGDMGNLNLRFIQSYKELDARFAEFLKWKRDRYNQRYSTSAAVYSEGGFWGDENVASYYKEVAERLLAKKRLGFSCLMLDEKMISAIFGIEKDGTFFYFSTAFCPVGAFSVGRIHIWLLVKELCSRSIKEFDFLIGDDDYKRKWPISINQLIEARLRRSSLLHNTRRLIPMAIEKVEYSSMFRRIYKKIKLCGFS